VGLERGTVSITVHLENHSTNQHSPLSRIVAYLNVVLFENGAKKMVAWKTRTSDFFVFFNTKKKKSTFT